MMDKLQGALLNATVIAAIIGLVEVILRRIWEKRDKKSGVTAKLDTLEKMLAAHIADDERYKAETKRARILQFNKEIRECSRHSEEEFVEILKVVDEYEDYCNTHPEFPNNRTRAAEKFISETYDECLRENKFL